MFRALRASLAGRARRDPDAGWGAPRLSEPDRGFTSRIPGFAESAEFVGALLHGSNKKRLADEVRPLGARNLGTRPAAGDLPFSTTGPQGHRHRMREKLLMRGAEALADYELLEMLLFFAQPKGDTKPLAKHLINQFGSFGCVLAASPDQLFKVRGLGEHSVAAIRLVQAAAVRLAHADLKAAPVFSNWDALVDYLNVVQGRNSIEQFRILYLDSRNRLLADEAQSRGTVNHTPVYPREIVRRALELHATALILVHNHPSGDPKPSRQDVAMTEEIVAALRPVEIVVHDHIIVGHGNWLSFRREGLLS